MSSSASTSPPAKRQKTSSDSTAVAPIFSSTKCINAVPVEVWRDHICKPYLNLKDLSTVRRTHSFFDLTTLYCVALFFFLADVFALMTW